MLMIARYITFAQRGMSERLQPLWSAYVFVYNEPYVTVAIPGVGFCMFPGVIFRIFDFFHPFLA